MAQVIEGSNSAQSPWERQSGLKPPQNQGPPIGGTPAPTEKWDRPSRQSIPCDAWSAAPPQRAYKSGDTRIARVERLLDQVEWIFNRGDTGWGSRDGGATFLPLARAYILRDLAVRLIRIPSSHCATATAGRIGSHGKESREHALLKRSVLLWAHSLGATDAKEEQWCAVGRADVYSAAHRWVIECGNTPIKKLVDAVRSEQQPRFTLVPYQRCPSSLPPAASLVAIDFVWCPALVEELRAEERARVEETRAAMDAACERMGLTAAVRRDPMFADALDAAEPALSRLNGRS